MVEKRETNTGYLFSDDYFFMKNLKSKPESNRPLLAMQVFRNFSIRDKIAI